MANYIILDTEGFATDKGAKDFGKVSLAYDIAWLVVTPEGVIPRHYLVREVFQDTRMSTAYYADKLPQYYEALGKGDLELMNFKNIYNLFRADCKEHKVKSVWAYNARYDRDSLNFTLRTLSNGFASFFIPYGVKWRDIWDYASVITGTKKFVRWCEQNSLISEKGNPSTTADTVGKYLRKDMTYAEEHTALSDCYDELQILEAAKRRKSKSRKTMGQGWRDAAATYKKMKA